MKRTGILGGTFDPPHRVHLEMAEKARADIPLHEVIFVPAQQPPHKSAVAPYEARVEMVRLAIAGREGMRLERLEEFRKGPSYTVDLLEHARAEYGGEIYFILGSDSLREIHTWKEPRRILELATLVVFVRPGYEPFLPVDGDASVVLFEEPLANLSSREIRRRIAVGEEVSPLLPQAVLEFILDNSLYT